MISETLSGDTVVPQAIRESTALRIIFRKKLRVLLTPSYLSAGIFQKP